MKKVQFVKTPENYRIPSFERLSSDKVKKNTRNIPETKKDPQFIKNKSRKYPKKII